MLEVLHMNTNNHPISSSLNTLSNGGPGHGPGGQAESASISAAPPRKSTSLITNQAIVKSALAKPATTNPRKPANPNKKEGNGSRRANNKQQRPDTAPASLETPTKQPAPSGPRKKTKSKSNDADIFTSTNSNKKQQQPSSKPSSASSSFSSLLLPGGGNSSSVSIDNTLTQQSSPSSRSTKNSRAKQPTGITSPVRPHSSSDISGTHTPKLSRKKKGRDGVKTPDRRHDNSNSFDNDSTKDLKEILFPDLYGAKSTPVKKRNNGPPQTPGNKQQPRMHNIPNNMGQPFTPQRSSPPGDIFAGSSFHNSPAPSALPKPSFKAKTSCTLYSAPDDTYNSATAFDRLISSKLANNGSNTSFAETNITPSNNAPISSATDNFSLENDLKRILNVNQG